MAYAGKSTQTRSKVEVARAGRGSGTLALGVAAGLLVGVGLALLLAPQSGGDTRRMLRRGLRKAGNRGRDAWDDLRYELLHARRELRRARRLKRELAARAAEATDAIPGP